jgi:hypothetical protein
MPIVAVIIPELTLLPGWQFRSVKWECLLFSDQENGRATRRNRHSIGYGLLSSVRSGARL